MKKIARKIIRLSGLLLLAFMLSVCVVMGVAPVLPRRKEPFAIEIKTEQVDRKEGTNEKQAEFECNKYVE